MPNDIRISSIFTVNTDNKAKIILNLSPRVTNSHKIKEYKALRSVLQVIIDTGTEFSDQAFIDAACRLDKRINNEYPDTEHGTLKDTNECPNCHHIEDGNYYGLDGWNVGEYLAMKYECTKCSTSWMWRSNCDQPTLTVS